MALPTKLRLLSKLVTLGLLITCTVMLARGGGIADLASMSGVQGPFLSPSIKSQPGAPLHLNLVANNPSDLKAPSITVEVTNTSTKAVRAYSISQEMTKGTEKSTWLMFADLGVLSEGLQAGQYAADELGYPPNWDGAGRMVLAIDLVEFADGTTWGPDEEGSSETLGGRRAGERVAGKRLSKIYKEKGFQEAIKSLGDRSLIVPSPDGYPPAWKEGFKNGQSFLVQRVKGALDKGGEKKAKEELRKVDEKFGGDK